MTASVRDIEAFAAAQQAELADRAPELPFSDTEYADRVARLRRQMTADRVDTVILTAPDTMCWLHGFTSRWYRTHSSTRCPPVHCTIVHADSDQIILIDTASHEHLARLTSCAGEFIGVPDEVAEPTAMDFIAVVVGELNGRRWLKGRIGLERWSSVPNPALASLIESTLTDRGVTPVDVSKLVRSIRRLKSPAELAVIERAQAACDAGVLYLRDHIEPGMSELRAWNLFMTGAIEAGGEPAAIHETVAAGPPMPMLHTLSSRRPIGRDEVFHPDAACAVDRYHARLTRPFLIGEPPPVLTRLTEILAGSYEVLHSTAKIGVAFRDVNCALRKYYAQEGVQGWAGGYELGVSFMPDWVGEFCWSSQDDTTDDVIEPGLVTNFETSASVVMVDTVVFEESGTRFLSSVPRALMAVPDAG